MTATIQPYTDLRTAPSVHGDRVVEMLVDGTEVHDGGRWALYCEHPDTTGVIQDTNRRRLWGWARYSDEWCPACQEHTDDMKEQI